MRLKLKSKKYKEAVEWIAFNDEPTLRELGEISYMISVQLIADLFKIDSVDVAVDVAKYREDQKNEN